MWQLPVAAAEIAAAEAAAIVVAAVVVLALVVLALVVLALVVVLAVVVLAVVVLAVVVVAFLVLAAVVVGLVVGPVVVVVPVAAEQAVAAEQVAQRLGRQDAAADAEGDLAGPGQEASAARPLVAVGLLLVRRPVTAVTRLAVTSLAAAPAGLGEAGRTAASLGLLLEVGDLGPQLPERGLLPHQRLGHLVDQGGRPLLDVLPDPGVGLRIRRSCLRGGLIEMLEQVVDGLLILSVHA